MEEKTITILDPVSKPKVTKISLNPRPKDIAGLRVAMVDNTKPNFSIFLDRVEELLVNRYNVGSVLRYRKPGRTEPIAQHVIAEIKEKYDIAITGSGDWGSCTSWSLHDTVDLEKQGVPTIIVTTSSFSGLAKMEAKAFGLTNVALLVVPHPIGAGLPEDQVKIKADNAIETLAKLMTGQC